MRFHLVTLGCDKNTVDSERYVAELAAHGAQPATSAEEADLIVINTCGFIDAAKEESIEAIVEAAKFKSSGSCRMVAAVGCMVERHAGELRDGRGHPAFSDHVPPTSRWRWILGDDTIWAACVQGCCQVETGGA